MNESPFYDLMHLIHLRTSHDTIEPDTTPIPIPIAILAPFVVAVGVDVIGFKEGLKDRRVIGFADGFFVGCAVGGEVGFFVGFAVGNAEGEVVGFFVGFAVGKDVGPAVGFFVGLAVG